jgi:hypothetical protein
MGRGISIVRAAAGAPAPLEAGGYTEAEHVDSIYLSRRSCPGDKSLISDDLVSLQSRIPGAVSAAVFYLDLHATPANIWLCSEHVRKVSAAMIDSNSLLECARSMESATGLDSALKPKGSNCPQGFDAAPDVTLKDARLVRTSIPLSLGII